MARPRLRFAWTPARGAAALGAALAASVTTPLVADEPVHRASGHATKKEVRGVQAIQPPALLATLAQTHTGERVILDERSPSQERFSAMLADRVTGARTELAPHLLELLRQMAERYPGARIELVSGFRSPKLNEMLRKKGRHVASKSQHSLGHACDFRIIPAGTEARVHPRVLEAEIRALGWKGGVGVYPSRDDGFVHADVGPNRRWIGK